MVRVLVYDLVSENHRVLRNTEYEDRLRAVRVKCTRLLHSLGVQCTESVILVSNGNLSRIQDVVTTVKARYNSIIDEIRRTLQVELPEPIIRILELTQEQVETFRELAFRHLQQNIDYQIDRVSLIIEQNQDQNSRNLVNSLRKLKREWIRIRNSCISLGIPLEQEIDYLVDLIEQAITQLGG